MSVSDIAQVYCMIKLLQGLLCLHKINNSTSGYIEAQVYVDLSCFIKINFYCENYIIIFQWIDYVEFIPGLMMDPNK